MKKINCFLLLLFFAFSFSFAAPIKAVSHFTIHFLPANQYLAGQLISNIDVEWAVTNPVSTGNYISISNGQLITLQGK